jgi:hypothetical protein
MQDRSGADQRPGSRARRLAHLARTREQGGLTGNGPIYLARDTDMTALDNLLTAAEKRDMLASRNEIQGSFA